MQLLSADDWYAAGSFWATALTGLAGLMVGAAGAFATSRGQKQPERRLIFGLPEVTPLLAAPDGVRDDLELRHKGSLLGEPYIAQVLLSCRGNVDIVSGDFDQQKPIRLDLSAPVIAILATDASPEGLRVPVVAMAGSGLEIGPAFISRKLDLTLTVLVEGRPSIGMESSISGVTPERLEKVQQRADLIQDVARIVTAAVPFGGSAFTTVAARAITRAVERSS